MIFSFPFSKNFFANMNDVIFHLLSLSSLAVMQQSASEKDRGGRSGQFAKRKY